MHCERRGLVVYLSKIVIHDPTVIDHQIFTFELVDSVKVMLDVLLSLTIYRGLPSEVSRDHILFHKLLIQPFDGLLHNIHTSHVVHIHYIRHVRHSEGSTKKFLSIQIVFPSVIP